MVNWTQHRHYISAQEGQEHNMSPRVSTQIRKLILLHRHLFAAGWHRSVSGCYLQDLLGICKTEKYILLQVLEDTPAYPPKIYFSIQFFKTSNQPTYNPPMHQSLPLLEGSQHGVLLPPLPLPPLLLRLFSALLVDASCCCQLSLCLQKSTVIQFNVILMGGGYYDNFDV